MVKQSLPLIFQQEFLEKKLVQQVSQLVCRWWWPLPFQVAVARRETQIDICRVAVSRGVLLIESFENTYA